MTCEEFNETKKKMPWEVSRAVRAAMIKHVQGCPACDAALTREANETEEEIKKMSPETQMLVEAVVRLVREDTAEDCKDPEYRQTIDEKGE